MCIFKVPLFLLSVLDLISEIIFFNFYRFGSNGFMGIFPFIWGRNIKSL